jgi:hypothetical protein
MTVILLLNVVVVNQYTATDARIFGITNQSKIIILMFLLMMSLRAAVTISV